MSDKDAKKGPAEAPGVKMETKDGTIQISAEAFLKMQERLEALESKAASEDRAAQIKQLGPLTGPKTQEEIDRFLNEERSPYEIFAKDWSRAVQILPSKKVYDEDEKMHRTLPVLFLKFRRYRGPGAEFPNPKKPSQGLFPWGHQNLLDLPEVRSEKNPHGVYDPDFVLKALARCPMWQEGDLFPASVAQIIIGAHYEKERSTRRIEEKMQERVQHTTAMLLKTGRFAPATDEEVAHVGAAVGADSNSQIARELLSGAR